MAKYVVIQLIVVDQRHLPYLVTASVSSVLEMCMWTVYILTKIDIVAVTMCPPLVTQMIMLSLLWANVLSYAMPIVIALVLVECMFVITTLLSMKSHEMYPTDLETKSTITTTRVLLFILYTTTIWSCAYDGVLNIPLQCVAILGASVLVLWHVFLVTNICTPNLVVTIVEFVLAFCTVSTLSSIVYFHTLSTTSEMPFARMLQNITSAPIAIFEAVLVSIAIRGGMLERDDDRWANPTIIAAPPRR